MDVADDITHYDAIEGYVRPASVAAGESALVRVSTEHDRFDISVHRWGAERQLVWSQDGVEGVAQPTPPGADAAGCGWSPTVEIDTAGWRSGFYLVTLTVHGAPAGRDVGYAGFVVRANQPTTDVLFVLATNTWNAYNNWGGRSLYTGGHEVSFDRPWGRGMLMRPEVHNVDRKSPIRRPGEAPDIDGDAYQAYRFANGYPGYMGSAGWFTYDRRFVEWAERDHISIDYAISSDLDSVPGLTDGYRLVIGAGHDEYWTWEGRDAVERHVAGGGNYASLSGNTMFWQVRFERQATSMVCHKYSALEHDPVALEDPSRMTGMWSDSTVARPERNFLGAASMYGLYSRFGQATPRGVGGFVVYRPDHWVLAGTELRYGDVLGNDCGVLGYETVGTRYTLGNDNLPVAIADPGLVGDSLPEQHEIIALTPVSNLAMGEYPASIAALDDQGDLEFVAERVYGDAPGAIERVRHGNAVISTCRPFGSLGGEVVTVGSTDWVYGLADDPLVAQVTRNIVAIMQLKP